MTDDGGVLGNLPRSRPGRRSEKRESEAAAKPAGARTAKPAGARAKRAAGARRAAGAAAGEQPRSGEADPVGAALRTVAGLATSGVRVADGLAREVLRRVPRP